MGVPANFLIDGPRLSGAYSGGLDQVSPTPRLQTGTGPWLVRNQAAKEEMSGR